MDRIIVLTEKIEELKMSNENKNEVISKDLMTIPNAISFIRILLITPFVAFFIERMYVAAAITVGISGLSDCFDGIIEIMLCNI